MLKIILVRHGCSQANVEKRYAGLFETPLTDEGRLQARAAAECLRQYPISAIYSSDISRARDTAGIISDALGLDVAISPLLRELDGGQWEGITMAERAERYPELVKNWENNISVCRCPGGESISELCLRARRAIDEIKSMHADGCVAAVSHGIFIRAILGIVKYGDVSGVQEIPWMGNTSISIIECENDTERVALLNSTAHLDNI